MSFSLTHPTPQPDAAIGPKQPGVNYYDRAVESWLTAQLDVFKIGEFEKQIIMFSKRISAGQHWFAVNDQDHPKHDHNSRKINQLRDSRAESVHAIDELLMAIWRRCCDVFVSWSHCSPDERWRWTIETSMNDIQSPSELWKRLKLDREPPGSWPPEENEWWIL